MKKRWWIGLAAIAAGIVLGQAPGYASTVNVPAGDSYNFFEAWPSDADDHAEVRVENLTTEDMDVTVEVVDNPPVTAVLPGYQIIDMTKIELITDPEVMGRKRMKARVRKKCSARIRRRARSAGYRLEDLVLMAKGRQAPPGQVRPLWRPCARRMRLRGHRTRKKEERATFEFGDYGVDVQNGYVWAVTDFPGSYAIGVPEPATVGCLLAGAGALILSRRRRRR